jgi:hypothetical protein
MVDSIGRRSPPKTQQVVLLQPVGDRITDWLDIAGGCSIGAVASMKEEIKRPP